VKCYGGVECKATSIMQPPLLPYCAQHQGIQMLLDCYERPLEFSESR